MVIRKRLSLEGFLYFQHIDILKNSKSRKLFKGSAHMAGSDKKCICNFLQIRQREKIFMDIGNQRRLDSRGML